MERLGSPIAKSAPCRNPGCTFGDEAQTIEFAGVEVGGYCAGCVELTDAWDAERDEQARRSLLLAKLDVPPRLRGLTLTTWPRDPDGAHALAEAAAWLEGYRGGERRNLLLQGDNGRGKTGLAVGVALRLASADLVECGFVNWRDWLGAQREAIGRRERFELNVRGVPVLVLDDLGAERPTDFAREELALLVERRYGSLLPTIVTTNYRLGDLAVRLGHDDLTIGKRIVSRLAEDALVVEVGGPDRRQREPLPPPIPPWLLDS